MSNSISVPTGGVYSKASFLSLKRFGAYFKYYTESNAKKLLMSSVIILVAAFAIELMMFYSQAVSAYQTTAIPSASDPLWSSRCELYRIVFMLVMIIAGSKTFSEIARRSDRLRTLELPASQFEKLSTWIVVYLPLTIMVSWICFWLADMLLVLWAHLFTPFGDKIQLLGFSQIMATSSSKISTPSEVLELTGFYSSAVIFNSIYALGSILFHRLAFLKTSIALFILGSILAVSVYIGVTIFEPHGVPNEILDLPGNEYLSSVKAACTTVVVCGLIYWFCYARLRQEEIIERW